MLNLLKIILRFGLSTLNFIYYWFRYIKYSGISLNLNDSKILKFHVLKIIHALEKSMCFIKQNYKSGFRNFYLLEKIKNRKNLKTFEKNYVKNILLEFDSFKKNEINNIPNDEFYNFHKSIYFKSNNFKNFFASRRSCRNFTKKIVSFSTIKKAVNYAITSPSVCNRRTWKFYVYQNKKKINQILELQNGNKGFTETIYNLGIITVDLKAFASGNEVYQSWIEGGIFSSTLVYAFHSLGVANCCLNWSQSASNDIKLRQITNINKSENIIMLLAFGYSDNYPVCKSLVDSTENFIIRE
jgi:nitroreductase